MTRALYGDMIIVQLKDVWHVPQHESLHYNDDDAVWWGTRCFVSSGVAWKRTALHVGAPTCIQCLAAIELHKQRYGLYPETGRTVLERLLGLIDGQKETAPATAPQDERYATDQRRP